MQCGNLAEFPVAAVYFSWGGGTKANLPITQWLENRALSSVQENMQWAEEAIFVRKTALNWLHMSYVMRSCGTKAMVICIFANLHQNPVVILVCFISLCLNTSPHGKLGVETNMEKMTWSQQRLFWREEKKKTFCQKVLQRCWLWSNDSSPSVLRVCSA